MPQSAPEEASKRVGNRNKHENYFHLCLDRAQPEAQRSPRALMNQDSKAQQRSCLASRRISSPFSADPSTLALSHAPAVLGVCACWSDVIMATICNHGNDGECVSTGETRIKPIRYRPFGLLTKTPRRTDDNHVKRRRTR